MSFLYSLKLFGNNATKALKLLLYYLVIWGVCFALLLPIGFAFKDLISSGFKEISGTFTGVFQHNLGQGLFALIGSIYGFVVAIFTANPALASYGVIVLFLILPILLNIGKYTYSEMIYRYMTSLAKVGFLGTLIKSLKSSVVYAILRTLHNLVFLAIAIFGIYGLAQVQNDMFITYLLPLVIYVLLVVVFTANQLLVLGWKSALIVFDCNVFCGYKKGIKAVRRHFVSTLTATTLYFVLFWAFAMIFGFYTLFVLVPLFSALICVFNLVAFFTSQGMRFYYSKQQIRTPKKLEEVDSINKTACLL